MKDIQDLYQSDRRTNILSDQNKILGRQTTKKAYRKNLISLAIRSANAEQYKEALN